MAGETSTIIPAVNIPSAPAIPTAPIVPPGVPKSSEAITRAPLEAPITTQGGMDVSSEPSADSAAIEEVIKNANGDRPPTDPPGPNDFPNPESALENIAVETLPSEGTSEGDSPQETVGAPVERYAPEAQREMGEIYTRIVRSVGDIKDANGVFIGDANRVVGGIGDIGISGGNKQDVQMNVGRLNNLITENRSGIVPATDVMQEIASISQEANPALQEQRIGELEQRIKTTVDTIRQGRASLVAQRGRIIQGVEGEKNHAASMVRQADAPDISRNTAEQRQSTRDNIDAKADYTRSVGSGENTLRKSSDEAGSQEARLLSRNDDDFQTMRQLLHAPVAQAPVTGGSATQNGEIASNGAITQMMAEGAAEGGLKGVGADGAESDMQRAPVATDGETNIAAAAATDGLPAAQEEAGVDQQAVINEHIGVEGVSNVPSVDASSDHAEASQAISGVSTEPIDFQGSQLPGGEEIPGSNDITEGVHREEPGVADQPSTDRKAEVTHIDARQSQAAQTKPDNGMQPPSSSADATSRTAVDVITAEMHRAAEAKSDVAPSPEPGHTAEAQPQSEESVASVVSSDANTPDQGQSSVVTPDQQPAVTDGASSPLIKGSAEAKERYEQYVKDMNLNNAEIRGLESGLANNSIGAEEKKKIAEKLAKLQQQARNMEKGLEEVRLDSMTDNELFEDIDSRMEGPIHKRFAKEKGLRHLFDNRRKYQTAGEINRMNSTLAEVNLADFGTEMGEEARSVMERADINGYNVPREFDGDIGTILKRIRYKYTPRAKWLLRRANSPEAELLIAREQLRALTGQMEDEELRDLNNKGIVRFLAELLFTAIAVVTPVFLNTANTVYEEETRPQR